MRLPPRDNNHDTIASRICRAPNLFEGSPILSGFPDHSSTAISNTSDRFRTEPNLCRKVVSRSGTASSRSGTGSREPRYLPKAPRTDRVSSNAAASRPASVCGETLRRFAQIPPTVVQHGQRGLMISLGHAIEILGGLLVTGVEWRRAAPAFFLSSLYDCLPVW